MKTLKKIIYLLMITVCISVSLKAQQSVNDAKIITITNFKVYKNNAQVIIDWSAEGTVDANYWQVQNSTDGKQYNTIALVFGPDPRQQGNRFQYKGKIREAVAGTKMYYRVSPVDTKGDEINTKIILPAK